jgi:tetratricopeptide (TPR) repeat protein
MRKFFEKALFDPEAFMKALISVRAVLLGATAIVAFAQAARADFNEDQHACNQDATPADQRVAACSRQIESGKWEGHNLAVSYSNRGLAYRARGDRDPAIADFNRAIQLDAKFAAAYNNRAIAYREKGDPDRAIADFDQALQFDPKYTAAFNNRANAYMAKKDYDRAVADFSRAIELDPKYSVAFNGRGAAYANKGDYDRAIAEYTQAIQLDPKYALAYNSRAIAYKGKGDLDHAIADYTQVITIDPSASSYSNRADAYDDKRDYDRSIADYTKAIEFNPKAPDLFHNRALEYRFKGDVASAIADYTQEIQVDPKLWRAYFSRGNVSVLMGALPPAMADLNKAAELAPKNAYIALWIEIANRRSSSAGHLADAAKQVDMTNWPAPVVNFYLGQSTVEALLAAANSGDAAQRTKQTCAANFYIGEFVLQQGKMTDAARLFKSAADASCRTSPLEYFSAQSELKALGAN